jgi:hypothetical protein
MSWFWNESTWTPFGFQNLFGHMYYTRALFNCMAETICQTHMHRLIAWLEPFVKHTGTTILYGWNHL